MIRCGREKKQIRWLFTRNQHKYLPTFICKHTNTQRHTHTNIRDGDDISDADSTDDTGWTGILLLLHTN